MPWMHPIVYQDYDAIVPSLIGPLGLCATEQWLGLIDFLPPDAPLHPPQTPLLREVARQIAAYGADPAFRFDLPYRLEGTPHQRAVWERIAAIPLGEIVRYAEIAWQVGSSARAVGTACGRNPLPIVIPCHRVVAKQGLGGFNANRNGVDWGPLKYKLLVHEGVL
ncbi:methylated-DNA--protein-cysteine methyltransferase [Chitiniphilus shinanonensis]|uniref:Methylated-DNA--protein-cysteine methyltransferase n=1 Tax=Chitiniphilus shinanonensis TaxID=553088 RepID=A0ABQ6BVB0_9NEIS|nr:methylated-DNA--[protein]-cysteine S-methyltransferase [Chitiniphilus shinanonensis]GLS03699.1 methylated-DNA--protein-cysteine methyltransferase [Chitiniphilus shinanonensis]